MYPQMNNPYPQVGAYQYVPSQWSTQLQPVNGITKVNGRDSALQYQLPPNSISPALFDQDGTCFYIVSTDGTGMKTVECFDFSPRVESSPTSVGGASAVSREEFDALVARVNGLIGGTANGIHGSVQPSTSTTATPDGNAGIQAQ